MIMIKRAIISVSDKNHLLALAKALCSHKVEIIATNRTCLYLSENKIPCTMLADYIGFPEMIHGRVKTLHPKVFAGILARHQYGEIEEITTYGVRKIDLVCVNLYPFQDAIQHSDLEEKWLDEIDIGGVSLLRASAKNYQECVTLSDPSDYPDFINSLNKNNGCVPISYSFECMKRAFLRTSYYDAQIAMQFCNREKEELTVTYLQKNTPLRYGENPHQQAALWTTYPPVSSFPMGLRMIHGKEMSYNNYLDSSMGLQLLDEFDRPASVIVKHNNPCGCAESDNLDEAYERAYACDPVSAYGGIFLFNRPVTESIAKHIHEHFTEVVVAPSFDENALSFLTQKKNIRLLKREEILHPLREVKSLYQSYLIQTPDNKLCSGMEVMTGEVLSPEEIEEIQFGLKVVKHVKSNAIVITNHHTTLGIGSGQPNRINSTKLSLSQAGEEAKGAILCSDAYFPFVDSIQEAAKHGIRIMVEPGGSIRDAEIIDEAKKHDIIIVFTGLRHFLH